MAAAVIMAMTSGANVAVALLSGKLADTVRNSLPNLDNELGRPAGRILIIKSLVYMGQELMKNFTHSAAFSLHWSIRLKILPRLVSSRIADFSGPTCSARHEWSVISLGVSFQTVGQRPGTFFFSVHEFRPFSSYPGTPKFHQC